MRKLGLVHINGACMEFTGFGVRELYTELTGRPPVWNSRTRRWVGTPRRAPDLTALAMLRGYDVTVTGEDRRPVLVSAEAQPEPAGQNWLASRASGSEGQLW